MARSFSFGNKTSTPNASTTKLTNSTLKYLTNQVPIIYKQAVINLLAQWSAETLSNKYSVEQWTYYWSQTSQ